MSRIGSNPNLSSDHLEARMLPNVDPPKHVIDGQEPDIDEPEPERGGTIDLKGDGVHKVYLHRGQLDIYNFGSRSTKVRAARGFGKTSYLGVHMIKVTLGLFRQMGGFVGASAKQLYTRTMPNALKIVNQLGFEQFYFIGQAPAKLRWAYPLAKPRSWENCVHFQNGFVWQMLSMAVRGSANGLNLAALVGDETKYLPWKRVKEEVLPTLRGDFMPAAARKTEQKRWGYGTDPKINPYWLSQLWVSDAGLTQRQCEWEKEDQYETRDINRQIAEMLAELKYLEKRNPKMAVQLAQNEVFLKKLNLLRSQSETFWNFSSIENAAMLGGEPWIRQMKRELPDLMFNIQILGKKKGAAKDGYYANWDIDIHGYQSPDCFSFLADKTMVKRKGKALDAQNWPTDYETESIDIAEAQRMGEDCSLDLDVDYTQPLSIAVDCNANLNCVVVGQTRQFEGRESLLVLKSMFVQNERKLRSLCADLSQYYRSHLRRNGEIIFYYTFTIKQGGSTAYAVEGAEEFRFDRVVVQELQARGWRVTDIEIPVIRDKYQVINDILSGKTGPFLRVNTEAGRNEYLITAIENAGLIPGTFKKDKTREKLKATDEESLGGDPRTRTDITDALDDLLLGVKFRDAAHPKIGGALRSRFKHLANIPK